MKDLINTKAGVEFEYWAKDEIGMSVNIKDWIDDVFNLINLIGIDNPELFEPIVDRVKFKVGDYVVTDDDSYIKISMIHKNSEGYYSYDWYEADALRSPTNKEYELYFR